MAINEELDQKFGADFCLFLSHDFVRKHIRPAENALGQCETANFPVQHVEKSLEPTSNDKNASLSIADLSNASIHDESFKTAVSEEMLSVASTSYESANVDKPGILTTFVQRVEYPKATASDEQSDANSVADISDCKINTDKATSSAQNVKSSKAHCSDELLKSNSSETGNSKYFTRNQTKAVKCYKGSRLDEVEELGLDRPKQKPTNGSQFARKKIKLHQPNKVFQKNFAAINKDFDADNDFEMLDDDETAGPSAYNLNNNRFNNGNVRKKFDISEDHNILKFIFQHTRSTEVKGNKLWKDMEEAKVNYPRPWASLKERFRKTIVQKLSIYTEMFNLDKEKVNELLNNIERNPLKN